MINPAKSDLGRVAKCLLENINSQVQAKTGALQWRSTGETLKWFRDLPRDEDLTFLKFDIEAFYPSITRTLLDKAMKFADTMVGPISDQDQKIISLAFQSFLFNEGTPWTKRGTVEQSDKFDVTMGCYAGAEAAELVGLYLLSKMTDPTGCFEQRNVGLYRDDGLAIIKGTGRTTELTKKKLHRIFKEENLKITVENNLRRTEYLDVILDLEIGRAHV